MIMADILKIFLLIVGGLTIYVSYWLVAHALFPNVVQRASERYATPVRITLLGLAIGVIPFVAGAKISQLPNPVLKLIGVVIMAVPVLLGLVGSTGLVRRIGAGLPSPLDERQPWRRVLRGGVLLSLTFLLPFFGWFVLPVWALASGLGAFVLSLKSMKSTPDHPPPVMNPSPA